MIDPFVSKFFHSRLDPFSEDVSGSKLFPFSVEPFSGGDFPFRADSLRRQVVNGKEKQAVRTIVYLIKNDGKSTICMLSPFTYEFKYKENIF